MHSWPPILQAHLTYLSENEMVMCIARSEEICKDLLGECSDRDGFPQALADDEREISERLHDVLRSNTLKAQVRRLGPEYARGFMEALAKELNTNPSHLKAQGLLSSAQQLFVDVSVVCGDVPKELYVSRIENVTNPYPQRGANADIYQGTLHGRSVALKVLRDLSDSGLRKDFFREAATWKLLQSDHILTFLGIDEASFGPGSVGIVSPWMRHGNIVEHLKKSNSSKHNIERYLVEVAEGVCYLHSMKVPHGDLRGANILIDENFMVKIADFGLARFIDTSHPKSISSAGVARWMAPELLSNEKVVPTIESDIYSFAMVCFEIYTLRPPFNDMSDFMVYDLVVNKSKRPPWPNEDNLEWTLPPLKVKELIECCWSQEYSMRGSMDEVARTLKNLLEGNVSGMPYV